MGGQSAAVKAVPRIEDGFLAHRAGRLDEAARAYRAIIAADPCHFDALHLLGVVSTHHARYDEAAELIRRALKLNPRSVDAHYNLGVALDAAGNRDEAIVSYRKALAIDPSHAPSLNNLGASLRAVGKLDEAIVAFRGAVAYQPDYADAHYNLGLALHDFSAYEDSLVSIEQALALNSAHAPAHNVKGALLLGLGHPEQAAQCLQQALELQPNLAEAHNNLGVALTSLFRHDEAINHLNAALAIRPGYSEAYNNLGNTQKYCHQYEQALLSYRRAVALKPDSVEAKNNLGSILGVLNRAKEALVCYRELMEMKPDYAPAHSEYIFMLDYVPGEGAAVGTDFTEHQEERRRWYERHAARFMSQIEPHSNERNPERKLRVGYISPYMMSNSFGTWLFRPLIRKHDRSRFEVFLYSDVKTPDGETQTFKDTDSVWRETVALSDEALAGLIRNDGIDILIDLTGHASANRLLTFARKPAPVQISAWGHPTGTGLPTMDYLFADPVAIPESARSLFAEKIFDLPCFLGYEPPDYAPDVVVAPSANSRPVTFGCLNRLSKITERSLALWCRLLRETPGARLVLKDTQLSDPKERSRMTKAFEDRGIDLDRLVLLAATSHREHLAAYNTIDIALDPFPQSGGVSTFEALWMGVPVVALLGPSVSGRGAAAIMSSLGLQDWVAGSEDDYLVLAKRKAADVTVLAALRPQLRPLMAGTPVGDSRQYTRAVEAAYRNIWINYCRS